MTKVHAPVIMAAKTRSVFDFQSIQQHIATQNSVTVSRGDLFSTLPSSTAISVILCG
jgi:hypothetical protein